MQFESTTHKFTIFTRIPVDYYLTIGKVGVDHWFTFPHLNVGDICYLDLTVSHRADELRVYEVLFSLANKLIEVGGTVDDIIFVLKNQQMEPAGSTTNNHIPMCKSICDYVAKYLEVRK